ncbi:MAG: HlyD family efflux transporter periplasmic adaptor subunit [Myxococcales bacterium]|nr:HlyD family efflux transporter periplasmic adaptor subunit [Myxococcales bacterium]
MVRPGIPFARRLRANLGVIANAAAWSGSAIICAILYLAGGSDGGTRAVALVVRHPVVVPISGRLAAIDVQVGTRVEAGQQLGLVAVPGLEQRVIAAQAELQILHSTLAAGDPAEARRYAKDSAGAQARWLSARVEWESVRAEQLGVDVELSRLRSPGLAVSAVDVERLSARHATLAARGAALAVEVGALERAYVVATGLEAAGTDNVLEARVQAAAARVEELRALQEAAILRAPAAGTVAAVPHTVGATPTDIGTLPAPGTWVEAGIAALSVVETSSREAVAYLPPAQARELQPGEPVTLISTERLSIASTVVAVGAAVEPVPLRQLADPAIVEWGVPVTVRTNAALLTPGEAFSFLR